MSMLERYNKLSTLTGFSQGFFTFFKRFRYVENYKYQGVTWREQPFMSGRKSIDIREYVIEQMKWIEDFRTQEQIPRRSKQIFFECRKRMSFFVSELESLPRQRDAILSEHFYINLDEIKRESNVCLRTTDTITRPEQSGYYQRPDPRFVEDLQDLRWNRYRSRSRSRDRIPLPPAKSEPIFFVDKIPSFNSFPKKEAEK